MEKSTEQLADLKGKVGELALFFQKMVGVIQYAVNENVEGFLNPVRKSLKKNEDGEDELKTIRETSKKVSEEISPETYHPQPL